MAAEVQFDDKEVRSFLKDVDSRLKDVKDGRKEYLGLLTSIVFRDVMDHFEKEESPSGKWKSWSPSYKDHLNSIGMSGNKILQFNGRLRQNFKPQSYRKTSQGFLWFNDAVTKSGYPYAWGHNTGDGKLPQREFMWLSDDAMDDVADQTLQFILEKGV